MSSSLPGQPVAGGAQRSAVDGMHAEVAPDELVRSFAEADVEAQQTHLGRYATEDWISLGFFWLMAGLVFVQFFTRYVLNDSFAWTEELAVYCLMPVVFVGSALCVRRARHIQVNILYRYLPAAVGRMLSTVVDVLAIAFYAYAAWLVARFALLVDNEPMTTIEGNKSHVYWLAFGGFALMALRAVQVAVANRRRGYSPLERPEAFADE